MKHAVLTAALAALVALPTTSGDRVFAQAASGQQDALRQQIEQRFDVIPLQNGVAAPSEKRRPSRPLD